MELIEGGKRGWLGFPPGRRFIVLPAGNRAQALAGLDLYDAVSRRQVAYLAAGRLLLRCGLESSLSLDAPPVLLDESWWTSWVADCVEPVVGPIDGAAFRVLGSGITEAERLTMLLFDARGVAVAFGKVWSGGEAPSQRPIIESLTREPMASFSVPELLSGGEYEGKSYILQKPLPEGGHRRMAPNPHRLRAVISDMQTMLETAIPRDGDLVPIHGSMTPLNLREDTAGRLWLLDWDKVSRGPQIYDEVRYWIGDAGRRNPSGSRLVMRKLMQHLDATQRLEDVKAALAWRERVRPQEVLASEQLIRDRLVAAVDSASQR